jgi:C-terminal processing protease CtpA/Prc
MTRILALLAPFVMAFAVAQTFGQTTPPPPQQPPKVSNEPTQTNQNNQNQSTQQREKQNESSQQAEKRNQPGRSSTQQQQSNQTQERNQTQSQKDRDTNKSSDSNKDAQPRTAMRPKDLRAPDIGLWFDRKAREGLVISDVSTKGPIAKLGFKEGDRIVSVNGKKVSREGDFIDYLISNNRRIDVIVTREGREETIQVDPAVLLEDYGSTEVDPLEQIGIIVDDRYDDRIVVWRVIPRSPAYYAGIRAGDVLATLDSHRLGTRQEFEKSVTALNPGEVGVEIRRGDRTRELTVDVPRFETRAERRTAMRPNLDERRNERSDEKRATPLRPNR